MLNVKDIHTHYGRIEALKGISLEVKSGEIVSLIGSNGAGKTTTLMTISGIVRRSSGSISFEGNEIDLSAPDHIVKAGILQVPEGRRIFPRMSVLENLLMGAFLREDRTEIDHEIEKVLTTFPILKERINQKGGTLSGGEQQMLAIGRALMAKPRLLMLDEPSLGLSPIMVNTIFRIIREIRESGTSILLVEQNALMALSIAQRGYVLETGRIVLADSSRALLENEQVQKAYLGG